MSDGNAGGRYHDPRRLPDWYEQSDPERAQPGSSVFGGNGAPAPPPPRTAAPPPRPPYPPPQAPAPAPGWASQPTQWRQDTAPYPTDAYSPRAYPPQPQQERPQARRPEPREEGPSGPAPGRTGGRSFVGPVLGILGAALFIAALAVLPWFEVGGEEVDLADIRQAFTVPETDPDDILASGDSPPPSLPDGGVPSPDDVTGAAGAVTDAVEDRVREEAAQAVAGAIDGTKARYLELYADTLWLVVAGAVGVAVLASALLGLRRLAALAIVLAVATHGVALWVVFSGSGGPSPLPTVWLGLVGGALAFAGALVGRPRTR